MGGQDDLLAAVLESMEHGVAMVDADLRLSRCNGRWRDMFGFPESLTRPGTPWSDILRFRLTADAEAGDRIPDLEARHADLMALADRSRRERVRYEIRRPDGAVLDAQSTPLPDGGFLRTFADVTAAAAKEEHLLKMQERYALALRSANEGLYDWDIQAGTIFFSDRLREQFGLPDGVLRPRDWMDRILPEDLPLYKSAHAAHLKGDTDRFVCEYRMYGPDGGIRWLRQHGIALRSSSGRALRLTGSVGDVTEHKEAVQALRESEQRHALAMSSINEGVYEWDIATGKVHVTERLRDHFGFGSAVIESGDWVERIYPSDLDAYLGEQRALVRGDIARLNMEYRIRVGSPTEGEWRWIRHRGVAVRDEAGRALRVIGAAGDITEQRAAEQALAESQAELRRERELLKATLENMDQGIFMADPMMRLVAHNRHFQTMFDLPDELFDGPVSLSSLLKHLCDRGDVPVSFEEAFERLLGEDACTTAYTREVRRPDDRVYEVRNVPIADGSFVRSFTDVTERRKAENAVRDLIEAMPLPLVVSSVDDHRYLYVNEHAQRTFGISADPDDPNSHSVASIYADPEDNIRLLKCLRKQGRVTDFEARLNTPAGEAWVVMSAHHMVYQDEPAVIVASTNITERKRLEADLKAAKDKAEKALRDLQDAQRNLIEAEKMASLGGLVAGVAHEINTPVGITLTTASHLEEKMKGVRRLFDEGKLRKQDFADFLSVGENACQLLLSNCTRAANLIQSFKQVAVDQTSDERRHFDLDQYIDEVLLSLGPKLKRTNYRITVDCPEGLEIDSFPGPLSQVLTNFVMNSVIHGFEGREDGTMRLTATPPDAEGMVELRYEDDGKGIPPDHLRRIFDPFFTTKRGVGGSGLGLNIVYNIVTQTLHGSIRAESEDGRGAAFILRFPARVGETQEHTGTKPDKNNTSEALAGLRG